MTIPMFTTEFRKASWFACWSDERKVVYQTRIGHLTDAKACDGTVTKSMHEMAYREAMEVKE